MRTLPILLLAVLFSCKEADPNKANGTIHQSTDKIKEELLAVERKWIEAEFALDTAYIATLLDTGFIDISADHLHNKQQALKEMYDNISVMRNDSIFLDSLKFEDVVVNLYENTAVISLVTHSYKKDKGKPVEKRMRFYDVWINRNGKWKAVSSQGSVVAE